MNIKEELEKLKISSDEQTKMLDEMIETANEILLHLGSGKEATDLLIGKLKNGGS